MLHLQVGTMSSSTSLDHKDHSNCTADMGWTACALLIVEAEASLRPMYFILPSSTSFFISPIFQKRHEVMTDSLLLKPRSFSACFVYMS